MEPYSKRRYHRPSAALRDVRQVVRDRRRLQALMCGQTIDAAFRERLMLAVTEVNGCRYCSYAHARVALTAGLTTAEIEALARGELDGAPPDQAVALLYARHWAETDGRPDATSRQRLLETYAEPKARAIELTLRTIRVGNLLGNTADYLLYRVSRGRRGGGTPRRAPG